MRCGDRAQSSPQFSGSLHGEASATPRVMLITAGAKGHVRQSFKQIMVDNRAAA